MINIKVKENKCMFVSKGTDSEKYQEMIMANLCLADAISKLMNMSIEEASLFLLQQNMMLINKAKEE